MSHCTLPLRIPKRICGFSAFFIIFQTAALASVAVPSSADAISDGEMYSGGDQPRAQVGAHAETSETSVPTSSEKEYTTPPSTPPPQEEKDEQGRSKEEY